jgi:hypothetical protein
VVDARIYIRQFALLFAGLCATLVATGLILDPFELYHPSFFTKDEILFNKRFQNAGLIETEWEEGGCCDTIFLGTSLSLNFDPDTAARILGRQGVLNLAMPGAYPREMEFLFENVVTSGRRPKLVFWEVIFREAADDEQAAYSDARIVALNSDYAARRPDRYFPAYLYDDTVHNDWPYLMSFDLYRNFARLYKKRRRARAAEAGETADAGDATADAPRMPPDMRRKPKTFPAPRETAFPNIEEILLPAVAANPDIAFAFFFPPFSRDFLAAMADEDFARYMQMRRHLVAALAPYPNVRIFGFDTLFGETADRDFYTDARHYDARLSAKILTATKSGQGVLTPATVEADIRRMTAILNRHGL